MTLPNWREITLRGESWTASDSSHIRVVGDSQLSLVGFVRGAAYTRSRVRRPRLFGLQRQSIVSCGERSRLNSVGIAICIASTRSRV